MRGHPLAGISGSNLAGDMEVCVSQCFMLSGGGLGVGFFTRPQESYRVWRVSVTVKPRYRGGSGPLGAVAQWKKMYKIFLGY